MKTGVCVVCKKEFLRERLRRPVDRTTCGVVCRNILIATTRTSESYDAVRGAGNPNWNGGVLHSHGYTYLLMPEHPRAFKKGNVGYVKRADLVLAEKIGRPLADDEIAHHKNYNRADDSPENLVLMTEKEHSLMHLQDASRARWGDKLHENIVQNASPSYVGSLNEELDNQEFNEASNE